MAVTLKNYATTLSPDLLQQAKKNAVRECDETEKGHFVAYVDDGKDSFDTSVTLKAGNEVIAHSCECDSKAPFCRHKTALLIHIVEGKKPKEAAVKAKKKINPTEALLDDADPYRLKEWVKGLIAKNKDIELSFNNYFAPKAELTPEQVVKIVNDAIKAVIASKKTIDATQLKKLVDLWGETLAPVMETYYNDVAGEKSFSNFHAMLQAYVDFRATTGTSSNKISKFIEDNLQKSVEPINNLQVEDAWDRVVGYFINLVPDGAYNFRMHYLTHLKNIISVSNEERKAKAIALLVKQLQKSNPDRMADGNVYQKFIFTLTEENGLFASYHQVFKPISWQNSYNERLIALLIENGNLTDARKYCLEQIKSNSKEDYNIPYLKLLKEILIIQKDDDELAKILTLQVPFTYNFDDYLFTAERLPEDERKKWRTKMFTRARNSNYASKKEAVEFCFSMLAHEDAYRKMIDIIEGYTPYDIILKYLENMIGADKNRLIEKILNKREDYGWGYSSANKAKDATYYPEVFKLFEKHYTIVFLKMAIQNREKNRWTSYEKSPFIEYMKQQLGM